MKKVICFLTVLAMILTISINTFAFSDSENHWAKEYIQKLTGMGVIKGRGDGLFYPYDTISRAEFTAILLRSLGNDVGQPNTGKWYDLYINEALNKGYFNKEEFEDVEQNISRLEITKILIRALNKEQLAEDLQGKYTGFKDDISIAAEDRGYVIALKEYGIIEGTDKGYFMSYKTATRAEASKMIVTFLENKDKQIEVQKNNYNSSPDGAYVYERKEKKELKIETDYPELQLHIKNALNIFADSSTDIFYDKQENMVKFSLFKNDADLNATLEGAVKTRNKILDYIIYTEPEPESFSYMPYVIQIYEPGNELAQKKFKELVEDVIPQSYPFLKGELEKMSADKNYENNITRKFDGPELDGEDLREIKCYSIKGMNEFTVIIGHEYEGDL